MFVPIAVGEESHFELSAMITAEVTATTNKAITTANTPRLSSPRPLDCGFSALSVIFCLLSEGIEPTRLKLKSFALGLEVAGSLLEQGTRRVSELSKSLVAGHRLHEAVIIPGVL